ncbi:MAG TPA: peptidyl-prolyl cis-trans isomerase [Candidatus Margulisiibacteriota bacterium]|nr:peptidyl-prolyl cis-trans isomerase [Candidatus Margulisiibacteriota bacterium]
MKNYRICVLLGIYLMVFGTLSLNFCFAQDKIIAVVNNDIITQKDLADFLNFMRLQFSRQYSQEETEEKIGSMKADLLDKLIEDRLILQEAKKEGIKLDEARVKGRINDIRKRYPTDGDFQNDLLRQGLVLADVENRIREQLLMVSEVDKNVRQNISISPEEVTRFYNQNTQEFVSPEKRIIQAVTLDNEDSAKAFASSLREGGKIADLASRYQASVNKIEVNKATELKKEIAEIVFNLKIGDVSEVQKIDDKYYVFMVENIVPPAQLTLAQVQENISQYLMEKKMQETLTKWLDELKKKSYIKISQD